MSTQDSDNKVLCTTCQQELPPTVKPCTIEKFPDGHPPSNNCPLLEEFLDPYVEERVTINLS